MFNVAARAATPDALLIFWSTAAIGAFAAGLYPVQGAGAAAARVEFDYAPPPWGWAALAYACMGLAVLAKGPIGVLLPCMVLGLFLLIGRQPAPSDGHLEPHMPPWRTRVTSWLHCFAPRHVLRTGWSLRPLTAAAVVLVVALPWYAAVAERTDGAWVRGFLWDHNVGRAARSLEGHGGSLFYYPVALLVGFFPWSVFAVPVAWEVVGHLRRRSPARAGLVLSLCWIAVYLGLFSLARTKLPSYITPCYPAVALLVGVFIHAWCTRTTRVAYAWQLAALVCLGLVGVAMLVALPLVIPRYLPGAMGLTGIAAIPLLTSVGGLWYLHRNLPRQAAVTFAVGACVLCGTSFAIGAACVDRQQTFDTFVAYLQEQEPAAEIGTLGVSEPSWVFYLGHPLDRLYVPQPDAVTPADAAQPLTAAATPVRDGAFEPPPLQKPAQDAWQYLRQRPQRFAITSQLYVQSLGGLPEGIVVVTRTPYFLRNDTLLLLAAR
jgi:4-amino-4-deoxy-L-arabinose transferase-like glycosyltransferase